MDEQLKPCPACGPDTRRERRHLGVSSVQMQCMHCLMRGPAAKSLPEAVEKWNALPRENKQVHVLKVHNGGRKVANGCL